MMWWWWWEEEEESECQKGEDTYCSRQLYTESELWPPCEPREIVEWVRRDSRESRGGWFTGDSQRVVQKACLCVCVAMCVRITASNNACVRHKALNVVPPSPKKPKKERAKGLVVRREREWRCSRERRLLYRYLRV